MAELPLVSIVTPSYQQARYLPDNLRSIREQTYSRIEHIVRDGGSTDSSVELLRAAPGVKWTSESDSGQTNALNKGIEQARGDIIGWVNSDDYLYRGAVARAVETFLRTGADAVYGRCRLVDGNGHHIGFYGTESFSYERLLTRNIVAQPALFFSRQLYDRFGPFDETLEFAMDYEYWLRCARGLSFIYVRDLFAAYRIHAEGKTSKDAVRHAGEANHLRLRYGRGVIPAERLWIACARTYLGGLVKSRRLGLRVLSALSWQRNRG